MVDSWLTSSFSYEQFIYYDIIKFHQCYLATDTFHPQSVYIKLNVQKFKCLLAPAGHLDFQGKKNSELWTFNGAPASLARLEESADLSYVNLRFIPER